MTEESVANQLPEPVSAANARAPNRRPRQRRAIQRWLTKREQDTFLRIYREQGFELACVAIQRTASCVLGWCQDKSEFLERWHQAKLIRTKILEGSTDDLTGKAIQVVDKTMDVKDDKRLRFDAAKEHLKGMGVYGNKTDVKLSGEVTLRVVEE